MPRGTYSVFINYRRIDSEHVSGRLYDRLVQRFGSGQVFMDTAGCIARGERFDETLQAALASAKAVVVVIGSEWLTCTDEATGLRRLDNPEDWVAKEIGAALKRGILVLPVLVNGASMPTVEQLPTQITQLASRQASEISGIRWPADVGEIIKAIETVINPRAARWKAYGSVGSLAAGVAILLLLWSRFPFTPADRTNDASVTRTAGSALAGEPKELVPSITPRDRATTTGSSEPARPPHRPSPGAESGRPNVESTNRSTGSASAPPSERPTAPAPTEPHNETPANAAPVAPTQPAQQPELESDDESTLTARGAEWLKRFRSYLEEGPAIAAGLRRDGDTPTGRVEGERFLSKVTGTTRAALGGDFVQCLGKTAQRRDGTIEEYSRAIGAAVTEVRERMIPAVKQRYRNGSTEPRQPAVCP